MLTMPLAIALTKERASKHDSVGVTGEQRVTRNTSDAKWVNGKDVRQGTFELISGIGASSAKNENSWTRCDR